MMLIQQMIHEKQNCVIKLSNNLENLLGWTYLGGDKQDRGTAVGVDNAGHVFVAGHTTSSEDWLPPPYDQFPITPGAFFSTRPPGACGLYFMGDLSP